MLSCLLAGRNDISAETTETIVLGNDPIDVRES